MLFPDPPEPHIPLVPNVVWKQKGKRVRAIWNTIYLSPPEETFHQFIVKILLWTLGKEWYEEQISLAATEKHTIIKWLESLHTWSQSKQTIWYQEGTGWKALPSGEVQSLMSLAYDFFAYKQSINFQNS